MFHSLRLRLLGLILLVMALVGVITVWTSYRSSEHEVQEMFDAELAQSARVLLSILLTRTRHEDFNSIQHFLDQGVGLSDKEYHNAQSWLGLEEHDYERKVAFQLWNREQGLLLHSPSVGNEPLSQTSLEQRQIGYYDEVRPDGRWRIFSLLDEQGDYLIQVGERYDIREELIGEIIIRILAPSVLSLPILTLLIWFSVGKAMKPLYRLRDAISQRDPDNLEYVSLGGVPDEVIPLVKELNQLFGALEKALENERRFTDDAAHELRTPLSALKTQVQVALRATSAEQQKESLNYVLSGVDRMSHLINQMLTLARLDSSYNHKAGEVDISQLVHSVERQLSDRIESKNLHVEYIPDDDTRIYTEATGLEILLRNIIENAINHSPQSSKVSIEVSRDGTDMTITVSDSGPGIDPADRERVFERYYRKPGQQQTGSGLGLSIARRCADLLGARLELKNVDKGSGLRVVIHLQPIPG